MEKFKVGIIGVSEPAGAELVRLLAQHPLAELTAVSADKLEGQRLSRIYPSLYRIFDGEIGSDDNVIENADIVFCAYDGRDNQELAAQCIKQKCVFIDLGPAFRLSSEDEYVQWFGGQFSYPGLHEAAIYGMPELMREVLPGKVLIGCPGPVAEAAIIALAPALSSGLMTTSGITIDAKLPSGLFGAGADDSIMLGAGGFRETAEIEQALSAAAGVSVRLTVVSGIIPSRRSVCVTCCGRGALAASEKTLRSAYERAYADDLFVRLLPAGAGIAASAVRGSNYCDVSLHYDERTATVAVSACLDYYMKGSAGTAVQCMNLLLSMPEGAGVDGFPII